MIAIIDKGQGLNKGEKIRYLFNIKKQLVSLKERVKVKINAIGRQKNGVCRANPEDYLPIDLKRVDS
jgi:hypothetical protein